MTVIIAIRSPELTGLMHRRRGMEHGRAGRKSTLAAFQIVPQLCELFLIVARPAR